MATSEVMPLSRVVRYDPVYDVAGRHLPSRALRIGIFDDFTRGTAGCDSLIGARTPKPTYVEYHDWCSDPSRVDVVCGTTRDYEIVLARKQDPSCPPAILFLQECRDLYPHPPLEFLLGFDLVLTSDFSLLDVLSQHPTKHGPRARWCSLIGTQLPLPYGIPPKRELCSLLDSGKRITEGHRIRHKLAQHPTVSAFGHGQGKFLPDKWDGFGPFYFNLAIENSLYESWITEKLFDCFISRTVPIYYGSVTMLPALGFDPSGVIPFTDKRQAERILSSLPTNWASEYESRSSAIDRNQARALQLTAPEVLVDALVRRQFNIPWV